MKSERLPVRDTAQGKFIHFKEFLFSASGDMKPQSLNSLSVPNCQVADGAVSPRVCLEKAANA